MECFTIGFGEKVEVEEDGAECKTEEERSKANRENLTQRFIQHVNPRHPETTVRFKPRMKCLFRMRVRNRQTISDHIIDNCTLAVNKRSTVSRCGSAISFAVRT